jgi:hypothetical protein
MNQKQYYNLLSQIKASARRSPVYLKADDDHRIITEESKTWSDWFGLSLDWFPDVDQFTEKQLRKINEYFSSLSDAYNLDYYVNDINDQEHVYKTFLNVMQNKSALMFVGRVVCDPYNVRTSSHMYAGDDYNPLLAYPKEEVRKFMQFLKSRLKTMNQFLLKREKENHFGPDKGKVIDIILQGDRSFEFLKTKQLSDKDIEQITDLLRKFINKLDYQLTYRCDMPPRLLLNSIYNAMDKYFPNQKVFDFCYLNCDFCEIRGYCIKPEIKRKYLKESEERKNQISNPSTNANLFDTPF